MYTPISADLHMPSVVRRRLRRSRELSAGVVEVVLSVVVAAVVLLLAVRVRYRNRKYLISIDDIILT